MPFCSKGKVAIELVERVAKELGLTEQGAAKSVVAAELDQSAEAAPLRERLSLEALRRDLGGRRP
jgi:hypothetical protein